MTTAHVGTPASRVDGRAKVTGAAKYAGEYAAPDLVYGVAVSAAVARGKITALDASAALALPGVLQVFTHEHTPSLAWLDRSYRDQIAPTGSPFRPLYDAHVHFSAQPIALVVAETFELARHAARLVRVEYRPDDHETDLLAHRGRAREPKKRPGIPPPPAARGDADRALADATVRVEAEFHLPAEHHNPMEPFATTVLYDAGGRLTVHDKTQGVQNVQEYLCNVFGFAKEDLRVVAPYVGGAFGAGLRPQYQVFLAVLAARELKRSVRVTLTRQQMFSFGHRPAAVQRVGLGADADGTLRAITHDSLQVTSRFEDYTEATVNWSAMMYRCDNVRLSHQVVPLDVHTPCDMRAPGAAWGIHALECALDELAAAAGIDPLELRRKNHADRDQSEDKPFSSKELLAAYDRGAEAFGWSRRAPAPRSMRRGGQLVGWGMAGGAWEAQQQKASARATLTADGRLTVSSATGDIGTGTYTIMTQIAAERLGLPLDRVRFVLGDSSLPTSPVEGGSWTASTIGSAVLAACDRVREALLGLAAKLPGSPLAGAGPGDVEFAEGLIRSRTHPSRAVPLLDAFRAGRVDVLEFEVTSRPSPVQSAYSRYAHSAVFAEVTVDEGLGVVRVPRIVTAVAGGRILNPKTARSQLMGGVVWGISMALREHSLLDHQFGRFMNHNLGEYHVPVNADVGEIEVLFVEERDEIVNPLGAKGLGEIGLVGVAAAIASAVYHATGKRVRELPITLDRLL